MKEKELKDKIIELTREYSKLVHSKNRPSDDPHRFVWKEGDPIPYAARVFTEEEVAAAVSTTLDFWLTLGQQGSKFQDDLYSFLGVRKSILVNSGYSANLLAIAALGSHRLSADKRLKSGDEIITVSAGFPTTVAPILQCGYVPVFVDADPVTGNVLASKLEDAYNNKKTKAVMMAHALGNPFNIAKVLQFCRDRNLWLIEDNCDALGSSYSMPSDQAISLGITENSPGLDVVEGQITRWTGTWGDISTQSFYPPHHITTGEGGAVNVRDSSKLCAIIESFRDWGRDCWCSSGEDNRCGKRYEWKLGELPYAYDHKYTYSHLGYNLKPLDIQASIGIVQLKRLRSFIQMRKDNWLFLRTQMSCLENVFDYCLPTHATAWSLENGFSWDETGCRSDCSWFGFAIKVKDSAPFTREQLVKELEANMIGNRMLFGGNLLRQPAFVELNKSQPASFRVCGEMSGADEIMNKTLFLGTYPGLTNEMLLHMVGVIKASYTLIQIVLSYEIDFRRNAGALRI